MTGGADKPRAVLDERRRHLRRLIWDWGPIGLLLRLRPPVPMLRPERYAVYLRALAERRSMPGAILEVGCFRGTTAAEAFRMLKLWNAERPYVCVDTFSGFVSEQFDEDEVLGTEPAFRSFFDSNSRRAVERTFRHLGYEIDVIEGDIATIPTHQLPAEIAVCLIDVDLASPVHAGLRKVLPRVLPGGIVLVDDCEEQDETVWPGARVGYERFIEETGRPQRYDAGFGIIEVPDRRAPA